MEVREFQKEIFEFTKRWDKKRKVIPNEQVAFNHLVEEVGELAREFVNKDIRKDKYSEEELENAIGDSLIQLVKLAHLRNLDIEEVVMKIIKEEEHRLKENETETL